MTFDYSSFSLTTESTENAFSIGMSIWLYANDDEFATYVQYLTEFTSDDSAELIAVVDWQQMVEDYDGYCLRV